MTFWKEQQQPFPLSPMEKRIVLLNNHIAVQSVSRNFHFLMIWRSMKELMVQNLSGAYSVIDSHCMITWNSTREAMLVKNHLTAQSVTRNLHLAVTWKNMKEPTLMKSHSVAYSVTRNSNTLVIWNNTEAIHVQYGYLSLSYSTRFILATSIKPGYRRNLVIRDKKAATNFSLITRFDCIENLE